MTQATEQDVQQFDIDNVFDTAGSGGSGAPSYDWPKQTDPKNKNRNVPVIGGEVVGEITDIYVTVVKDPQKNNEPKLDKRGRQQPQINLTLQTEYRNWERVVNVSLAEDGETPLPPEEDTGLRRIYVKYKLLESLAKAIKESEQKKGGPRVGAKVAIKVADLIYSKDPLRHPLPDYQSRYKAAPPAPTEADNAFEQFDQQSQQAQTTAPASDPWSDEAPF